MDHVPPAAPGAGGHIPLPLLMHPCPRAIVVSGDASRLHAMETGLRQEGYKEVETYTDPTVAMAMRRGRYQLVMVDMFPLRAGALELLECAISEMNAEAQALSKVGNRYRKLSIRDLETIRQTIKFNKSTSSEEGTLNHDDDDDDNNNNNSPTSTVSTATIGSSSGRRAPSMKMIRRHEMKSQEVEQDGEHTEAQRQQLTDKSKKARLVWTEELHNNFVDAYNKLLPKDRVPKKILRLMNDPRLSRENVASHLQKYRLNNLVCGEPQPIHRNDLRTQHPKLAQASLLHLNMSQVPSMMTQVPTATSVYMNQISNPETTIITSAKSDTDKKRMDVVVPEKITTLARSDTNNERVDAVVLEKMYTGPQVEMEHKVDTEPRQNKIICMLGISDGSFQEDCNDITQQTWVMNCNRDK
ncbi:hypothetical protein BRADI_2g11743v3 [Brachypodium distachyon]|uniref:Myb-like domain-containing protein n=1 Tax=Brachypodium distachyon TaxID=15368 RepID=A0A2K2D843_BRADI|nr:hypothetical protein BRADI_2g11743v3 [Brachypodium distachyon]